MCAGRFKKGFSFKVSVLSLPFNNFFWISKRIIFFVAEITFLPFILCFLNTLSLSLRVCSQLCLRRNCKKEKYNTLGNASKSSVKIIFVSFLVSLRSLTLSPLVLIKTLSMNSSVLSIYLFLMLKYSFVPIILHFFWGHVLLWDTIESQGLFTQKNTLTPIHVVLVHFGCYNSNNKNPYWVP